MLTSIWSKLTNLDNPDDVNQEMSKKYKNTILKLVHNKHTIYAKYTGQNKKGYHTFMDLMGNTIQIAYDTEVDVRIWYPQRGLYNVTTQGARHFVYFARTAYRQYRLGINEENTSIYDPALIWSAGMYRDCSLDNLNQIANKTYDMRHLDEVIVKILDPESDLIGYALNQRWGISAALTDKKNKFPLWLYNKHVADIEGNQIKFYDKSFMQELLDEPNKDWMVGYDIA